jgi:hypothetical protein
MRFRLRVVLAALFAALLAAPAIASAAAEPVSFCSGWTLGQRLEFRATRLVDSQNEDGTRSRVLSTLPIRLEVIQQDASGFRLAWTYGTTVLEENTGDPVNAWALSLFDGLRVELRTDASGRVLSVANARTVKEFLVAARRRLQTELAVLELDDEVRITVTKALHLLTDPEISANLPLPDIEFLLHICGRALEPGKWQRFDFMPAALGGESSGGMVSYLLRSLDEERARASIEWRNEESALAKEFLGALFRILAEAAGKPTQKLQIRDAGAIEFDLESGWPARVSHERTVRFGKNTRLRRVEMSFIPPPLDPT